MSSPLYALALCLASTGALAQAAATPPGGTAPGSPQSAATSSGAAPAGAPAQAPTPRQNSASGGSAGPNAASEDPKAANASRYSECVELWDRGTHMSKKDWSRTCRRIENRLQNLQVENLDVGSPPAKGRKKEKLPNAG